MKKIIVVIPILYLAACSPINSVAPFDDKQAAVLAKEMYGIKPHTTQNKMQQAT